MKLHQLFENSVKPVLTQKSDQHLTDMLDGVYGNLDLEDIEYIKKFYPRAYIKKPINMYRVVELSVKELYKQQIKNENDLIQYLSGFKGNEYQSWSTKRKGIDYFRRSNMKTQTKNFGFPDERAKHHFLNRAYPSATKKGISEMPVLFILEQQNQAIDMRRLLNIIRKSKDKLQSNVYVSRKGQMGEAHEVLSTTSPTLKIISIQVPYVTAEGKDMVTHLKPNEISKVYDIRKQMISKNHWSPDDSTDARHEDRWDTSSIPESFKQYLSSID